MRVTGTISRRDLAMIFARAADLGTENPATSRMGKQLLEKMLGRSSELVRDERPAPPLAMAPAPSPPRPPRAASEAGFDLLDLTRSMDGVLAGIDRAEEPTDPLPVRRQRGKLGLETLEELFVRGGQVRFEGYLEELEQTLEDLFQRFRSASREFGITIEDLEKGNLLGETPELLESRRAERKARRGGSDLQPGAGGRVPSSGRWPVVGPGGPAAPPQPPRPPSGRWPVAGRGAHPEPPRPSSGKWPSLQPAPGHPGQAQPSPAAPRPPSGRWARPHEPPAQSGPPRAPGNTPVRPMPRIVSAPPIDTRASAVIGEPWPDEPGGVRVSFARPGVFTVHCACGKERSIDTRSLPPWRIRCTSCRQVLFDPTTTLLLGDEPPAPAAPARAPKDEGDPFARWLRSSSELTELRETAAPCARHPSQTAVATCNRCARKLCRACLDQVGTAFACASCQEGAVTPAPVPLPAPFAPERPPTPAEVRRAFERALLMAAQEGDLERPGTSGTKRVRLIYDHQRRLFKVPLDLRLEPGDRLRLSDGRSIAVRAVRESTVDGVPCYQEVAWLPLG